MSDGFSAYYYLTDEITITEIRDSDRDSIVKHINDLEIARNTLHIPYPYHDIDAVQFLELCRTFEERFSHVSQFAIRWNGEMVGGIGFLYVYGETSHIAEIGYWIGVAYRGKGIMTEAIKRIVEIGFTEKGLFRIEANVFVENQGSIRALEKAGFQREGLRKARFLKDDQLMDAILYAVISGEI